MIEAIVAALIMAAIAYFGRGVLMAALGWVARGEREKARRAEQSLESFKMKQKAKEEAEIQDDEGLINRITRKFE